MTIACLPKVSLIRDPVRIVEPGRGERGRSRRWGLDSVLLAGIGLTTCRNIGHSHKVFVCVRAIGPVESHGLERGHEHFKVIVCWVGGIGRVYIWGLGLDFLESGWLGVFIRGLRAGIWAGKAWHMLARASNSEGLVVRALVDVLVIGLEDGVHALHEVVRVGAGQDITTQAVLHEGHERADAGTGLVDAGGRAKPGEMDRAHLDNVAPDILVGDVLDLLVSDGLGKLVLGHQVAVLDGSRDAAGITSVMDWVLQCLAQA